MVKIRYSELPAGLHVAAAADRDNTVVYLQPGLTSAQRRAALGRVRSSARMGHGPALPRQAMARAIAADRVRTNARIGAAAARRHPMLFLPPVFILVISAIAFGFMSIQPLTITNRGDVTAGMSTLRLGAAPAASAPAHVYGNRQRPHHHRRHRVAMPGRNLAGPAQTGALAACASLPPTSSRWPRSTQSSSSSNPLAAGCVRRFQRPSPIRQS